MSDPTAIITAVVGFSKQIVEAAKLAKDAKTQKLVADFELKMAELKSRVAELINENTELKDRLRQRGDKPKMTSRGDVYYTDAGAGPYCTTCFDVGGNLVRLTPQTPHFARSFGKYKCITGGDAGAGRGDPRGRGRGGVLAD